MKNTELTPLEIMEFTKTDYLPKGSVGLHTFDEYKYILEASADDSNLYKCLKANIMCSRKVYEAPTKKSLILKENWDINLFRDIISRNYLEIIFNLDVRWKVSILECFSYDGNTDEQLISSLIAQLYHMNNPMGPLINKIKADASFEPHIKDIVKILIRIKSIIPKCKHIGLISLDILRELYTQRFSIFTFLNNTPRQEVKNYINYIIYSSEFDTNKLYNESPAGA